MLHCGDDPIKGKRVTRRSSKCRLSKCCPILFRSCCSNIFKCCDLRWKFNNMFVYVLFQLCQSCSVGQQVIRKLLLLELNLRWFQEKDRLSSALLADSFYIQTGDVNRWNQQSKSGPECIKTRACLIVVHLNFWGFGTPRLSGQLVDRSLSVWNICALCAMAKCQWFLGFTLNL